MKSWGALLRWKYRQERHASRTIKESISRVTLASDDPGRDGFLTRHELAMRVSRIPATTTWRRNEPVIAPKPLFNSPFLQDRGQNTEEQSPSFPRYREKEIITMERLYRPTSSSKEKQKPLHIA